MFIFVGALGRVCLSVSVSVCELCVCLDLRSSFVGTLGRRGQETDEDGAGDELG